MGHEEKMRFSKNSGSGGLEKKKEDEIKITSPDDYMNMIELHPIEKINEDERRKEMVRQHYAIEAKVTAARLNARFKKYAEQGLLKEEIGYFPKDSDVNLETSKKLEDVYLENTEADYFVQVVPVFDKDNRYTGNKLFRVKNRIAKEKEKIKLQLDLEYQEEDNHRWFYEEQEKEKKLREKVKNGEMVYLGEINFDNYLKLKKDFPPLDTEEIWVFDENKNPIRDNMKYYARIKKLT